MGVALLVASMTALNTALGDLAVATSATQSQLNWIVDGYTVALACLLLPAGAALHTSTMVMAVIVAVAAVLIGLWAPGRDGRQLRPVRRIVTRFSARIRPHGARA